MVSEGFILIDKPIGITSHDCIDKLRKITGIRRIGHAGTLDPNASGLMIVAIGRDFTKQLDRFLKLDKKYIAQITLGASSSTYDSEGEITAGPDRVPTQGEIEKALLGFSGVILQTPPIYSALKIDGQPAYKRARNGEVVELKPRKVEVYQIEATGYEYPKLTLETHVSSGTYIRSIAHDLGQTLKTGAYLSGLRRTSIGKYGVADAHPMLKMDEKTVAIWRDLLYPVSLL